MTVLEFLMSTVGSKVPFGDLCRLLEQIEKIRGTDNKKRKLADFVNHWREVHNKLHEKRSDSDDSFYSCMRLILPHLERERAAYGIKENTLAKKYIDILCLNKESADAKKLLNYRAPKNATKEGQTDFASVAFFVLKNRCPEKGSLTIEDVNKCLDAVAEGNVTKNKELGQRNLLKLLHNCSALEQKWLIRVVMKEMKMGLSQASVFSVFHPDAEDLFNVSTNLEKVCKQLHDTKKRLHEVEICVFSAFSPMLAERASPGKVEKLMKGERFYIETKWDGERMQLHKQRDEYKYFSRRGHDYTYVFGSNPLEGTITPYIANCFCPCVKSCILDGEMLIYHKDEKFIGSKAENFDVKSVNERDDVQVLFCVFDIVMYNDIVLTNKSLEERMSYLCPSKLFKEVEGRLVYTDRHEGLTNQEVVSLLNAAIDERKEGIIVKSPASIYKPNARTKGGWLKIKPEYVGSLMDELDLVIVGGYFGVGSRGGLVSHFLVALAEPHSGGEEPRRFFSLARVGSGYTMTELYELCVKMKDHWQTFKKKSPPPWLALAAEKPDLFIEPSKSFIVQVKATEITDSDKYGAGCTLRFPRIEKIRYDKAWSQCMTTAELQELRNATESKLVSRHVHLDDEEEIDSPTKKKRRVVRTDKPVLIGSQFKAADVSGLTKVSELFNGLEMCVVNGPSTHSKQALEKLIVEHGGTIVQHPGPKTYCIIAERINLRVKNMIEHSDYDVVKADWVLRCCSRKTSIDWTPADMLNIPATTAKKFAINYDKYGDSFTNEITSDDLKKIFESMDKHSDIPEVTSEDIAMLEEEYWPNDNEESLFRMCRVYMDMFCIVGDAETKIPDSSLELVALQMRQFGAIIVEELDDNVTHVVVASNELSRAAELRRVNRIRERKFRLVTDRWVKDCCESKMLKDTRSYMPVG